MCIYIIVSGFTCASLTVRKDGGLALRGEDVLDEVAGGLSVHLLIGRSLAQDCIEFKLVRLNVLSEIETFSILEHRQRCACRTSRDTFSKVSALVYLLCTGTVCTGTAKGNK